MPLEHGARGCTSFNKLFFMRHFHEPIALQTTAMDQTTTVLGADDDVVEALATICDKNAPRVIGLITTGLSEMQGADVPRTIQEFRKKHPEHAGVAVVPVSASDTLGCLETGFAAAVEAMIKTLVLRRPVARKKPRQVNVLASVDADAGRSRRPASWIESFGLTPIILPDIGASLDGHLIEAGYSTLTYGGVTRAEIESMGNSAATLVIGRSMTRAADLLRRADGHIRLAFRPSDRPARLRRLYRGAGGNRRPPGRRQNSRRKRDQLTDAMVDCQFQFGGAKVGIAGDADLLGALTDFFVGMGANVIAAVASARAPRLAELPIENVVIGDLEDFETLVREQRRGPDRRQFAWRGNRPSHRRRAVARRLPGLRFLWRSRRDPGSAMAA